MAFKIQIISNAVEISDTVSGEILISQPARDSWFEEESLDRNLIVFYGTTSTNEDNIKKYRQNDNSFVGFPITDCVDSTDTPFITSTFRDFCYVSLGKSNASGGGASSTTGWAEYKDGTYTSANPLVIPEGTSVVLGNDASTSIETYLPSGVSSLYNGTTNRITPENVGDAYIVRVNFTSFTDVQSGALATLEIDIGDPSGIVILKRGFTFPKGAGLANSLELSSTNLIYSLSTFVANGGQLRVRSESGDTSIYDISYVIDRVHSAV